MDTYCTDIVCLLTYHSASCYNWMYWPLYSHITVRIWDLISYHSTLLTMIESCDSCGTHVSEIKHDMLNQLFYACRPEYFDYVRYWWINICRVQNGCQFLTGIIYIYKKFILLLVSDSLFMWVPLEWLLMYSIEAEQNSSDTYFILNAHNNYLLNIWCCQQLDLHLLLSATKWAYHLYD